MENKCPICKKENFESLDYLREREYGFQICKECGFVNYKPTMSEDKFIEMYVKSDHNKQRSFSGSKDLMTKHNKLPYHKAFLKEFLEKKKNLSVLDFGCSTGYTLNYIKSFGNKDLLGAELNPAHAELGKNEYGLDIRPYHKPEQVEKDFPNKKFDVIILYHVIEHLIDPVGKLKAFKKLLKDDGVIYMANPIWFECFKDASNMTGSFEGLYVKHHINVFSKQSHDNMLNAAGLEISKENNTYYGRTVFLKKSEPKEIKPQEYKGIIQILSAQKKAMEILNTTVHPNDLITRDKIFDDVKKTYKNFPEIYMHLAFVAFKDNFDKQVELMNEGIKNIPNHAEFYMKLGYIHMQNNKLDKAEEYYLKAYEMKPSLITCLYHVGEIYEIKEKFKKAIEYYKKVIEQSPQLKYQSINKDAETVLDRIGICYLKLAK